MQNEIVHIEHASQMQYFLFEKVGKYHIQSSPSIEKREENTTSASNHLYPIQTSS